MDTTAIMILVSLVIGHLVIDRLFVTPPKFLVFYLLLSAVLVGLTV